MKQWRELACEMGGHSICPARVIKVLGVLIDEQGGVLTDKSFSFYLHDTSADSYMVVPGMDSENYATM